MKTYISILRGINVGGQKKIKMSDLQTLYENLHFTDVTTYIQSGNVIFSTNDTTIDSISKKIEQAIFKKYKFEVPVIIRTQEEMSEVLSSNPFLKQKDIDIERLYVTFLNEKPSQASVSALESLDYSPDKFSIKNKEIFLYCPNSYGKTKFNNNFFESKLKLQATTRNWNTVTTLVEMTE